MISLLKYIPEPIKNRIRATKKRIDSLSYRGKGRYCPVCGGESARFMPFGIIPRPEAQCLHCGSLERHRFVWLYFQRHTNLFDGRPKKMLHVAPERCFVNTLEKLLGEHYLTADLSDPQAMVKMDITEINYPNNVFDIVYCSHVLEHVPDDLKAMREFYRVLAPNGWAILNVPIMAESTYEDSAIIDPKERLMAFGQEDHVRLYGPDYVDRLRKAGFGVGIINPEDLCSSDDALRMGIAKGAGEIYFCTKY